MLVDVGKRAATAAALAGSLAACETNSNWANGYALRAGAPVPNAAELRQTESAVFPLRDEMPLLSEATQALQDFGHAVEESAPRVGVRAGSKDRDATEVGQVVAQVALTVGLGILGVRHNPVWDTDQIIRVTLTTQPVSAESGTRLRASFERIVVNNQGESRAERLTLPEFNSGFFDQVRSGPAARSAVRS